MKPKILLSAILVGLAATSCSTPKDVVFFQDVHPGSELATSAVTQITIQPRDELFINVSCSDERLTDQFNLSRARNANSSGSGQGSFLGYLVDSDGNIDFPILGKLQVAGMTREEIAAYITRRLQEADLVKDPVITVNFVNLGVIVLGEVGRPSRIAIERDKMTLLDALAQAGDLTINGVRTDVMVIRDQGDKQMVYEVDLTDAASVYSSPAYYLQQEDVIYVRPNDKAIRQSTVNANTLQTYSFWMSLVTFMMSIGILIFK